MSFCAGSGFQDIRNIIPFSGKGVVLGGKSQTSSSSTSPGVKTPSFSAVDSPDRTSTTTASSFRNLTSPIRSDKTGRPPASQGTKPPAKKSNGQTSVFLNINGSPVKMPKSQCSAGGQGADKHKQKFIQDLFNNTNLKKSTPRFSNSDNETKRDMLPSSSSVFTKHESNHETSSISSKTDYSHLPSASNSKFRDSGGTGPPGAAGRGQASMKRQWDDSRSSASIFDFFNKTLGSSISASKESGNAKSAATSSSSSLQSSTGLHSVASSSASSSSSAMMVSCPVCQTEVQESKINEHLDSCLS